MQVAVPQGVLPGHQFRAIVDGREMVVTCPSNAGPGTMVRIFTQPPAPSPCQQPLAPPPSLPQPPPSLPQPPALQRGPPPAIEPPAGAPPPGPPRD